VAPITARSLRQDQLERAWPPQQHVLSQVDLAHAARAESAVQPVLPELARGTPLAAASLRASSVIGRKSAVVIPTRRTTRSATASSARSAYHAPVRGLTPSARRFQKKWRRLCPSRHALCQE
jgi:hypothetical protein